jgi:hypothetical protein
MGIRAMRSASHELLLKVSNPNLPDVAKEMGFRVIALEPGTANQRRVIAS